ncbi:MAG: sel1 repeat family protein, partial [Proteobacteria bacterium]|nr:sel1 repeat family protein [Pseudomonadota bacterium]
YGVGTPIDYALAAYWYGRAAEHGYLFAGYNLGLMHVKDLIRPRNDVEGLTRLLVAKARAKGDDPMHQFIAGDVDAQIGTISARMSAADVAKARREAAERVKDDNVTPVLLLDPQNNGGF